MPVPGLCSITSEPNPTLQQVAPQRLSIRSLASQRQLQGTARACATAAPIRHPLWPELGDQKQCMLLAVCPTFSKLGLHAKLIIGGGPHMKMNVFGPGGGRCEATISSLMKPIEYFQCVSGCTSSVYQMRTRGSLARSSSRSAHKMSSWVRLAKRMEMLTFLSLSATRACVVWSTGVMPEPPAMKPIVSNGFLSPLGVCVKVVSAPGGFGMPLGRVSSVLKTYSPSGPLTSIVSPTLSASRICVSLPPSGKRGWTPAK
mmetsp:Transcript_12452/g.31807  ORF Transcript_12452/g.31807 Transcript_12452/m.31807 type:complete len:258 (+) Transcript_12452:183-956(+)